MQVPVIVVHVETKELAFWSTCCKKNVASSRAKSKLFSVQFLLSYQEIIKSEARWVLVTVN